jgi:Tol biopolymer transport system component
VYSGGIMSMRKYLMASVMLSAICGMLYAQEAPMGSVSEASGAEQKAMADLKGKINGKIAWSSSRSNSKHDIWIMNADGTDPKQLTKGDEVDWFARFSPDGQAVLFTRSKSGWVPEADAEMFDKWDIWTIKVEGTDEKKVAESACWGTWRPTGDSIVFARGPKVFIKALSSGEEKELLDASALFKKGTYSQQPSLSPDGKLLAVTLRGTTRETGIYNLEKKAWNSTGGGCQISWYPDGKKVVRMNEGQGNGGTEVLSINIDGEGKPAEKITAMAIPKSVRLMDLPGRRSHEYFPKIDNSGQWMVWCATQTGHEHDIYDYEVYIWKPGTDQKSAVRLTFHSGNDRWPDLFTQK